MARNSLNSQNFMKQTMKKSKFNKNKNHSQILKIFKKHKKIQMNSVLNQIL